LPVATDIDSPHGDGAGSEIFAKQRDIASGGGVFANASIMPAVFECLDPRINDHDRREGRSRAQR
jgi:hypothetical protein